MVSEVNYSVCQISYLLLLNKSLPNSVTWNNIHHFTVSMGQGSRCSLCESSAVSDSHRLQSQCWLWSAEDLTGEDTALGHSRGWWQEAFPPGLLDWEFWFPMSWWPEALLYSLLPHMAACNMVAGFIKQAKGMARERVWTQVMVLCKVIQSELEDIGHSDPDHRNKGNVSIKWGTWIFLVSQYM